MTAPATRSAAPDEALVARFRKALERLWPEGGKLGLAVSGGPDSMAMLLLAEAAIPGRFEVATVDHGLRPEAADECAMVARLCAARSIPCETLNVAVSGGNLQAEARRARYEALTEWADRHELSAVATAHHADDQAETLLMRLNRGSGIAGLSAIRDCGSLPQSNVALLRPLLEFRRSELEGVVRAAGIEPVMDRSNDDDRFERVRIRKLLAASDWFDPAALALSVAFLAEANAVLDWAALREWKEKVRILDGEIRCQLRSPPRVIVLRVLDWIIGELGQPARGRDLARLLDKLEGGTGGNVGGVHVTVEGTEWVFRPEPPRRSG